MNINKRLERLEGEQSDAGFWNFENVSTEELIELRNLTNRDPPKAMELQQRLFNEGLLKYEHHQKQT